MKKKIIEIADILEVEIDEIDEDTILNDIETWDSVAVLSFIAVMKTNLINSLMPAKFLRIRP